MWCLAMLPSVAAIFRGRKSVVLSPPPSLARVFWVRFAELLLRSAAAATAADYWKNVICSRRRRQQRDPPRESVHVDGDDEAQYRVSPRSLARSSFSLCESEWTYGRTDVICKRVVRCSSVRRECLFPLLILLLRLERRAGITQLFTHIHSDEGKARERVRPKEPKELFQI